MADKPPPLPSALPQGLGPPPLLLEFIKVIYTIKLQCDCVICEINLTSLWLL